MRNFESLGMGMALACAALIVVAGASPHSDGAMIVSDVEGAATEVSHSSHGTPDVDSLVGGRDCCKGLVASCLACQAGVTVGEYCVLHPEAVGCEAYTKGKADETEPPMCCQAETAVCKACRSGIAVTELCLADPETPGCDVDPNFQATEEWQTVSPSQPIPAGLHVQLDMQTGERRVRFLPEDERPGVLTVSERRKKKLSEIQEAISTVNDGGEGVLDDDGAPVADDARINAFLKSLQEIKAKGLTVREDSEALLRIVGCLRKLATHENGEDSVAECGVTDHDEQGAHGLVLPLLEDLEDYVHQVDNAIDVGTMGGYSVLLDWLGNPNTTAAIRGQAAVVIGAACSNNPRAQDAALEAGVLQHLAAQLQAAVGAGRYVEAKQTVHAMGALARQRAQGVSHLHSVGALATLHDCLGAPDAPQALRLKVIHLITDMAQTVTIGDEDKEDTDHGVESVSGLIAARFCDHVAPLLTASLPTAGTDDTDIVEAAIDFATALTASCKDAADTKEDTYAESVLAVAESVATKISDAATRPDAPDYMTELHTRAQNLVSILKDLLAGTLREAELPRSSDDL
eukprot:m.184998 g.184998  ORF g.184998 m.184998 type:complete len:574 (+) comp16306_c0_seq1:385-2106(+)